MSATAPPWEPVTDLPEDAHGWGDGAYAITLGAWKDILGTVRSRSPDINKTFVDTWLTERHRRFSIENGQIEGLYTLAAGITEQLVTEGLHAARGQHSLHPVLDDATLQGLLNDQYDAIEQVFGVVNDGRPLSTDLLLEWHDLLTRHQEHATGVTDDGSLVEVPVHRGGFKDNPNRVQRADGSVHYFCPPERVSEELDRLFRLHGAHGDRFPTEVEAAWLHHRYLQIHPFQDGNGRTGRLLAAHVFASRGEFPPIVRSDDRARYVRALHAADDGDLRPLVRALARLADHSTDVAIDIAEHAQRSHAVYHHPDGRQSFHRRDRQPPATRDSAAQAWFYADAYPDPPAPEQPARQWGIQPGDPGGIRILHESDAGAPDHVHTAAGPRQAAEWLARSEGGQPRDVDALERQIAAEIAKVRATRNRPQEPER